MRSVCVPPAAGGLCGACAEGAAQGLPGTPCVACASNGGGLQLLVLVGALLIFCILYRQCIKTMLKHARRGRKSKYLTFTLLKIGMAFLFQTSLLARFQVSCCRRRSLAAPPAARRPVAPPRRRKATFHSITNVLRTQRALI